jgi:hypothetical protein
MHFQDNQPVEPPEHQILAARPNGGGKWRKLERYSSPVLVRPVRVWEKGSEQYVPVAIFTDCTLPPDVRPLVTVDPKAEPKTSDVVPSFEISRHANETLRRIEAAFEGNPAFHAL